MEGDGDGHDDHQDRCRVASAWPRKVSTAITFYAFATIDMIRAAVNAATPTPGDPAEHHLTEDALRALYRLR